MPMDTRSWDFCLFFMWVFLEFQDHAVQQKFGKIYVLHVKLRFWTSLFRAVYSMKTCNFVFENF